MEAFGTAAAIVGVIDVVARSILKLAEIRERYKSVELIVELLSGQLSTVKAALEQIDEFLSSALQDHEQHYQLVMSLDVAIRCCDSLVRLIDKQLSDLMYDKGNAMLKRSKIGLALNSKGMDECMTMLDRQINALNLLITVFQWYVQYTECYNIC